MRWETTPSPVEFDSITARKFDNEGKNVARGRPERRFYVFSGFVTLPCDKSRDGNARFFHE